jgi:hypothetical protein
MDTDFFEDNANWWNDPESGKANQCPYNTGYSRNNILRDNPLFSKLLPEINKYLRGARAHCSAIVSRVKPH